MNNIRSKYVLGGLLVTASVVAMTIWVNTDAVANAGAKKTVAVEPVNLEVQRYVPPLSTDTKPLMACNEYVDNSIINENWAEGKYENIKTLINSKQQSGTDEIVLDYVSAFSGWGLWRGRYLREGYKTNYKVPAYFEGDQQYAHYKSVELLNSLIETDDVKGIVAVVEKGEIVPDHIYSGEKAMVLLVEYLLESDLTNKAELIDNLVETGMTLHYSDLVAATKYGLPIDIVERMYRASGLGANKVLFRFSRFKSLTTYALNNQLYDLAKFWISQGAPISPGILDLNGLDLLSKHNKKLSQGQIDSLFELMANKGATTKYSGTVKRLNAAVSLDIFSNYNIKVPYKSGMTSGENGQILQMNRLISELHNLVLLDSHTADIDELKRCHFKVGKILVKAVIKNKPKPPATKTGPKADEKFVSNFSSLDSVIEKVSSQYANEKDIELALAGEQDLESKRLVVRYQQLRNEKLIEDINKKNEKDELHQELKPTIEEVFKLAKAGRWDEAIVLMRTIDMPSSDAMTTLLMVALSTEADFKIIKILLDGGAKFMPSSIFNLFQGDNYKLIEPLIPYGLDVNYKDHNGNSAVTYAVMVRSYNALEVLLKNKADLGQETLGFDALDYALQNFSMYGDGDIYISALINAGAVIELSHQQTVHNMLDTRMTEYMHLVSKWPELIN